MYYINIFLPNKKNGKIGYRFLHNEFDKKGKICDTEELLYYSYKIGKKDYEYYVYEEGGNLTKMTRKELKKKINQKKYTTIGKKENYGADCGDNFFRD